MSLVSILAELKRAQGAAYAVPHFDVFDLAQAEGAFAALVEKRAPGIIAIYCALFEGPSARALVAYLRARAEEVPVPVSVLLDHGADLEQCAQAIRYGCTDVMFDGSRLPLAQNTAETRQIVRAAHAVGVGVEAELGHVGDGHNYEELAGRREGFTDPAAAAEFVQETGVDFLAVAIGTAHGFYRGQPRLDLDLLREIRGCVDVPLVLHGGTGLEGAPLRAAIAGGIAKINVSTDLFASAARRVVETARAGEPSYFDLGKAATEACRERCAFYIDLFGAANRA